jgi:hypothetical protein
VVEPQGETLTIVGATSIHGVIPWAAHERLFESELAPKRRRRDGKRDAAFAPTRHPDPDREPLITRKAKSGANG